MYFVDQKFIFRYLYTFLGYLGPVNEVAKKQPMLIIQVRFISTQHCQLKIVKKIIVTPSFFFVIFRLAWVNKCKSEITFSNNFNTQLNRLS